MISDKEALRFVHAQVNLQDSEGFKHYMRKYWVQPLAVDLLDGKYTAWQVKRRIVRLARLHRLALEATKDRPTLFAEVMDAAAAEGERVFEHVPTYIFQLDSYDVIKRKCPWAEQETLDSLNDAFLGLFTHVCARLEETGVPRLYVKEQAVPLAHTAFTAYLADHAQELRAGQHEAIR